MAFASSGGSVNGFGYSYNGYNNVGFVVGGGAETKITNNITGGFEGLYYGMADQTENIGYGVTVKTSVDAFALRGRLTYRFGY